ncbi:MAG: hypothetical protein WCE90_12425 [Candidatus Zixiibacteriota bacterium]
MKKDEKVKRDLESLIPCYKKGSTEYLEAKTRFEEIEREFNASFNPEVKIPAKVKEKLCNYGIIDFNCQVIDSQIPKYVENDIWTNGENRILNPLGRLVREIVRKKGDIPLVDLLTEKEKQIIRDFRTPKDRKAEPTDIFYLSKEIKGLYLDQTSDARLPKAEAAVYHYLATRRPEELGSVYVDKPDRYKQKIQSIESKSRMPLSYFYNSVPKTKYERLVWDALDNWWSLPSFLPPQNLLREKQVLKDLNLEPYPYTFLTSDEVSIPQKYLILRDEIIAETKGKRLPVPGLSVIEETVEDVIQSIETTFFYGIRDKDEQIREKLTTGQTFWIARFLKMKHNRVYEYYLQRTRQILNKLKKIEDGDEFEEFEYLDLKARLNGDLLFACVFHDYVRGGERYLRIPRRPGEKKKDQQIKRVIGEVRYTLIETLKRFGIRKPMEKALLLINALAGEEVYPCTLKGIDTLEADYKRDKKKQKDGSRKGSKIG